MLFSETVAFAPEILTNDDYLIKYKLFDCEFYQYAGANSSIPYIRNNLKITLDGSSKTYLALDALNVMRKSIDSLASAPSLNDSMYDVLSRYYGFTGVAEINLKNYDRDTKLYNMTWLAIRTILDKAVENDPFPYVISSLYQENNRITKTAEEEVVGNYENAFASGDYLFSNFFIMNMKMKQEHIQPGESISSTYGIGYMNKITSFSRNKGFGSKFQFAPPPPAPPGGAPAPPGGAPAPPGGAPAPPGGAPAQSANLTSSLIATIEATTPESLDKEIAQSLEQLYNDLVALYDNNLQNKLLTEFGNYVNGGQTFRTAISELYTLNNLFLVIENFLVGFNVGSYQIKRLGKNVGDALTFSEWNNLIQDGSMDSGKFYAVEIVDSTGAAAFNQSIVSDFETKLTQFETDFNSLKNTLSTGGYQVPSALNLQLAQSNWTNSGKNSEVSSISMTLDENLPSSVYTDIFYKYTKLFGNGLELNSKLLLNHISKRLPL